MNDDRRVVRRPAIDPSTLLFALLGAVLERRPGSWLGLASLDIESVDTVARRY